MKSAASIIALVWGLASGGLALAVPRDVADPQFLFAFGDSYTWTGFNITLQPQPSAASPMGNPAFPGYTYDGGVNWVGYLVEDAPANTLVYNFACPGATVNTSIIGLPKPLSFLDQMQEFTDYVSTPTADAPWTSDNSVFSVWIGINDIGLSFEEGAPFASYLGDIFDDYFAQIDALHGFGARRFLFLTVPPTNRTPLFSALSADKRAIVKKYIKMWNNELTKRTAAAIKQYSDSTFTVIETAPLFNPVLNHPTKYGAPNASCYNSDGTSCLWWNNYHPGQAIQKVVGTAVFNALTKDGFFN